MDEVGRDVTQSVMSELASKIFGGFGPFGCLTKHNQKGGEEVQLTTLLLACGEKSFKKVKRKKE